MATAKIFSTRLRELCDTAPSISKVARDLHINRQQFARYLNGTTMPRENVIRQIGEYFNIDPGELFQEKARQGVQQSTLAGAIAGVFKDAIAEPILPHELQPGFYMQYKQTFSMPNKILCNLAQIRLIDGVFHYRRRTSCKLTKYLPGASIRNSCKGVFFKQSGMLVMVDVGSAMRELTFHAFRPGSMYDQNVKPGVHLTPGRQGSVGPRAARIVLHKLAPEMSVLQAARLQRLTTLEEVPDVIRLHLDEPEYSMPGVFGLC